MVGRGALTSLLWIGLLVLNLRVGSWESWRGLEQLPLLTHTRRHTRAHRHPCPLSSAAASSGSQLPLSSWSTSSSGSLSLRLPPLLAFLELALRAPRFRWVPLFFLSLSPSPGLIDDHRHPMGLTTAPSSPEHPNSLTPPTSAS